MDVNFLAISVGNTRTRIGSFLDGKLADSAVFDNTALDVITTHLDQAYEPLRDKSESCVVLASVNPPVDEQVAGIVKSNLGASLYRIESDLKVPIGRHLDPETLIGQDRLLNAAAAYDTLKQTCVVIDAGTAMTVDFIDGAGTFHGGAIAPGANMMLESLHGGTSQLPEVRLVKPDEPIGHSTAQAMLTAVYYGMRGMVRELVEQYAEIAGAFPMVVATGGDAAFLFEDDDLVDRVVEDLTLQGMAVTLQTVMRAES